MDVIEINGQNYYIARDYSYYVIEVDNTLTLSKSGNVTLYSSLTEYNNNNSGYPQIQLQYGRKARYITRSGQTTQTQDLNLNSWDFVNRNKLGDPMLSIYILIVISVAIVWRLFRR